MTDDEFKRHLYRKLEEDKRNEGILTTRIYHKPQPSNKPKAKPLRNSK
jgi:hypothetical protein